MRALARKVLRDEAIHAVVPLARSLPDTLAVGGMLKSSVCVISGDRAYVSQPAGNLDSAEAISRFEERVATMLALTGVEPRVVAHDLHPDFHSTRYAAESGLPMHAVQHHHAHIAALVAEHHVDGPIIGLALDGFGLGFGNEAWGGELLLVDGPEFKRLGHLVTMLQPGGDVAAREPWRMAAAVLHRLGRGAEIATRFTQFRSSGMLHMMMEKGISCPSTSSAGRLFDAACGLLGIHPLAEYEGQAATRLQSITLEPRVMAGGWTITADNQLDFLPLLERLLDAEPRYGAELFHGTLAAGLVDWAERAAASHGIDRVALGGGCFVNRVLADCLVQRLKDRRLKPFIAQYVSPGDAGLSLGQAWVAGLAAARNGG